MAKLEVTPIGDRIPMGRYVEQTFRIDLLRDRKNDWIDFKDGEQKLISVTGAFGERGANGARFNFKRDALGTGQAEGSTPGVLGIERTGGGTGLRALYLTLRFKL